MDSPSLSMVVSTAPSHTGRGGKEGNGIMVTTARDIENFCAPRVEDRTATEFIGLLRGVLADDVLDPKEAKFLLKWIEANPVIRIHPALGSAVKEALPLLKASDIRAIDVLRNAVGEEPTTSPTFYLTCPVPKVSFRGKNFCFTGTFNYGTRQKCEQSTEALGARIDKGVYKRTDFLVLGSQVTKTWIQSSFGRKIETAQTNRSAGCPISIISEETWLEALKNGEDVLPSQPPVISSRVTPVYEEPVRYYNASPNPQPSPKPKRVRVWERKVFWVASGLFPLGFLIDAEGLYRIAGAVFIGMLIWEAYQTNKESKIP